MAPPGRTAKNPHKPRPQVSAVSRLLTLRCRLGFSIRRKSDFSPSQMLMAPSDDLLGLVQKKNRRDYFSPPPPHRSVSCHFVIGLTLLWRVEDEVVAVVSRQVSTLQVFIRPPPALWRRAFEWQGEGFLSARSCAQASPVGKRTGGTARSMAARSRSSHGGSLSFVPSFSAGSSTVKPGLLVAISNSTPPGSR